MHVSLALALGDPQFLLRLARLFSALSQFWGMRGTVTASPAFRKECTPHPLCPNLARHTWTSDKACCVNQTGVNRAPEWKDDFDNARHERRLEAVACTRLLRLSKNPKTGKISTHNSFIFKSRFSMKMPKLDFFDSLVRPPLVSKGLEKSGFRYLFHTMKQ